MSRRGFYARLPLTASRLLREQLRLDDDVKAFEAFAEKQWRAQSALDLAILPDEGVARRMRDIQALLERTGTVMLTSASSTLGAHLALKTVLERVAPLDAERSRSRSRAASATSRARARASASCTSPPSRGASRRRARPSSGRRPTGLDAMPEGPTRRALQSFLELYGDRAVREAELSTPRWREDARPGAPHAPRGAAHRRARGRGDARARPRPRPTPRWPSSCPRLNVVEQTLVRHLVARAQRAARLRERMRAWVTRVLGMLREAALDADRRLLRRDPELDADWRRLARGGLAARRPCAACSSSPSTRSSGALRASRADLAPLVRSRRAELARDQARPDPPATFVGSPPPVVLPPSGGDLLRGLAGERRRRRGAGARRAVREDEMDALLPGEILVVHTTDVGWTPLFLVAAGVVTELGGPLSHAAVVAREFGVPSVVNVVGATRAIRTGDVLRVDGDRGVVERVRPT